MNLGTAYSDAGRSAEARREYEAALAVYRDLGDHAGQMHTLGNLANLDLRAGNYAAALAAYEANLKTARDLGRRPSVAIAHNNLGKVLLQVGRFREAGEQFDASLRLAREMTQRETEAYALDGLGEAALKQGRYPEALRQHEAAREVYRAMGHRRGEADAVANTSVVYKAMGRYGEALARIQTSLAARREIGDRTGEVTTLNNLSLALAQAGRYEESARQAEAALKIARTQGRARSEAIALKSLGDCATARGRFDEALPFYEAALAINRANHYRDDEAYALAGRAWCLMRLGRDADAFEDYTAGRAILAELGLRGAEAAILVSIADVLIGRKEYDRARGLLQDATALAEPLADAQTLGRAYVALGASYAWQKRWSEAVAAYRQAIARFESVRADLRDPGLQASYLGRSMAPYTNLTACLLDQGGPTAAADAFRAAEQAKARTLVDLLGQGKADLRKGMTDAERREDERLQADVSALTVQLQRMQADHVEAARQKELARRLADARGESDLFRQQVFLAHPEFQTRQARFEPATPEELNRTLFAREPGLCIVDYLIDNNELLVFTLRAGPAGGPARLAIKRLEFGDTKIAAAVAAFRAGCQSPAQPVPDSKLLYEKLLAPVAEDLAGATHVILVPDGALHMLPFQALADGQGRYLVERLPVSYAPSVTALVKMAELAERRRHEGGASGVLAVGRPAYGGSLPDLPASEAEARTVAALYGGRSTVLLGAQADRASVLAALPAAGRVHLATHGLLSEANPLYSAVALSPKGDNDDGRLYARDLLDLDLHADLVVLSACETALGQEVKGEGVLGLAWALFAAGSPSSVVTQWSVADASTAAVMAEFHKRLAAGAPKAEALRAAQLALLDRYDLATGQLRGVGGVAVDTTARTAGTRLHPFYWAPFVLIGDWR
jgi:CHAT domain-containing protein/tetratricopeptide (TPR) repeat protein